MEVQSGYTMVLNIYKNEFKEFDNVNYWGEIGVGESLRRRSWEEILSTLSEGSKRTSRMTKALMVKPFYVYFINYMSHSFIEEFIEIYPKIRGGKTIQVRKKEETT